jgi:membrane-bound lytic murein transglycosylase F
MRRFEIICTLFALFLMTGCKEKKSTQLTPWGTPMAQESDSVKTDFRLDDIINNGELIMLTLNGPENYYDYHGHGMGLQYMLCEKFCQTIGVSLRVEVCRDTMEMVSKLKKGEGDVVAFALPKTIRNVLFCGAYNEAKTSWAVGEENKELADTLNHWFKPGLIAQIKKEEEWMFSSQSIVRHVYSPMLNRSAGIISNYDHLFQKYSPVARFDWRLLAAQCYQESTFDSRAHSWAGACGLMQILPSTAERLGLPVSQIYEPEANIAAAAKYISQLDYKFNDVHSRLDRIYFILASYNGGYNHIRDAMALTKKYGRNPYMWSDVEPFVLKLREAQYYNDPIVRHGYMRSDETVGYVQRIKARWNEYRGVSGGGFSGSFGSMTPQRATKRYRFHI